MPGTHGADLTDAQAFQDYVHSLDGKLFAKMFTGFSTAMMDISMHEGLKGKHTLNEFEVSNDLVRAWSCEYNPQEDQYKIIPREISTELAKWEMDICPQNFEQTYYGFLRKKGQTVADFPFQAYILEHMVNKYHTEMDTALWQGEVVGPIQPGATPLKEMINGYTTIITNEVAAGNLTPVVSTGNIVTDIETMYASIDSTCDTGMLKVFLSKARYIEYFQQYRQDYGQNNPQLSNTNGYNSISLDIGNNVEIVSVPGMQGSNRIIMTPSTNLHYGYDAKDDKDLINLQQDKRIMQFWCDFRIGAQIGLINDNYLVVNDQP